MTDGSSGNNGHSGSFGTASNSDNVPRRISYASVASGANSQNAINAFRAGAFAHMATTTSSGAQASGYTGDARNPRRYSQEQDSAGGSSKRQSQLLAYSRKYSGLPASGSKQHTNAFLVPSYLKNSRYAEKLEALHTRRSRNERETRSGVHTGVASANQSSSSVNAPRIAPSHRGMTYEVIESNPPKDEDQILLLPTRWSDSDKYPGLDISTDGLEVRYGGSQPKSDLEAASVRADHPMSPACGIYYFEVKIESKGKDCAVAVGFSTSTASLERLPGWEPNSWAYHGDDGKTFCGENNGRPYNYTFTAGDIVGCGINFNTGQAFFTKNGLDLGVAFREMKSLKPFPCIGIKKYSQAVVRVNFGQEPFLFDIDEKVMQEKIAVENQIKATKTNVLHPSLDETSLIQELVSQFLMHGGYVETSKAFEEEMRKEKISLGNEAAGTSRSMSETDSTHASNRQQIRRAILAGDIDLALDITNKRYPSVLLSSPEIIFHLKCRKWIELIGKAADIRSRQAANSQTRTAGKSTNGVERPLISSEAVEDGFDQQMELDEEQHYTVNGTGKAPADLTSSNVDTDTAYRQLMDEALEYGQILQREYRDQKDSKYDQTLKDIFSLIIYDDPRDSVNGHLLDVDGRVRVAEELNSAILVFLGRPPTAALENAYKQTETLLDLLGVEGGPATFVNLRATFSTRG